MKTKQCNIIGIIACIIVAIIMILFYLFLMGGENFHFVKFNRNYPYLVRYVLNFVLPIILAWAFYFVCRPTTWVRYWLYALMVIGAALSLFMFVRMAWSIATDEYIATDIIFREPFDTSGVLRLGQCIYDLLFMLFLPWLWFDRHDHIENKSYGGYFGIAVLATFVLWFHWILPPPPPMHTYGGEQLLFFLAFFLVFGFTSMLYLIYYSIVLAFKSKSK